MPLSAATGRSEAACAETASSEQRQAISVQARVTVPTMFSKRLFSDRLLSARSGRVFNSPPETGEDMKVSSPVKSGQGGRQMLLRPNSELVRPRVPQGHIFVRTVTA